MSFIQFYEELLNVQTTEGGQVAFIILDATEVVLTMANENQIPCGCWLNFFDRLTISR